MMSGGLLKTPTYHFLSGNRAIAKWYNIVSKIDDVILIIVQRNTVLKTRQQSSEKQMVFFSFNITFQHFWS